MPAGSSVLCVRREGGEGGAIHYACTGSRRGRGSCWAAGGKALFILPEPNPGLNRRGGERKPPDRRPVSQAGTSHALSAGAQAKALSGDLARMHLSLTSQVPHDSACICGPTGTTHKVSEPALPASPPGVGHPPPSAPPTRLGSQVGTKREAVWGPGAQRKACTPELVQGKRLQAPHCSSRPGCVGLGPGSPRFAPLSMDAPELVLTFPPGLGPGPFAQQASHRPQFLSSTSPSLLFLDHKPPHGIMA